MGKIIRLMILLCIAMSGAAQNNYTVLYQHLNYVDSNGKSDRPGLKGALYVMGDTMTIYRLAWKEKELLKKLDLNSRQAHHGIMNRLKDDFFIEIVHDKYGGSFIKSPNDTAKWVMLPNDTILILNKKCVAAIRDYVVIWYAPSIPLKAGPINCFGLPGLVLAVYNSLYNYVYTAYKIIPSVPEIVTTGKLEIITQETFRAQQKKEIYNRDNNLQIRKFTIPD